MLNKIPMFFFNPNPKFYNNNLSIVQFVMETEI